MGQGLHTEVDCDRHKSEALLVLHWCQEESTYLTGERARMPNPSSWLHGRIVLTQHAVWFLKLLRWQNSWHG